LQYIISAKDNVSRVFGDVGVAMGAMGKEMEKVNKAMVGAGVVAVALGAALLKVFASTVSAAADWEMQMHEIWTLMDTEPKTALAGIQEGLFELSKRVPQSLGALADGLYWVMSSGYKGATAIDVLEQSAKLAVATLTDTESAARVLVGTMQAYALPASEAARVSDILFKTIEIGIVNMEQLAEPWGALIGMAGMTGVSIGEVGAAFATLTREGLNAAHAGTAIRGMINNILGATPELVTAWSTVSDKTIQVTLAQEGLTGVVSKLSLILGDETSELIEIAKVTGDDEAAFLAMAEAQGIQMTSLKAMFPNIRGLIGFMGLLANGGALWTMSLDEMTNSSGSTEKAFAKMMDTFQAKWQLAVNAFDRLKISIGQGVLPVFSALADVFAKVGNALDKLPQSVKTFIGIALGIGGVTLIIAGLMAILSSNIAAIVGAAILHMLPYAAAILGAVLLISLAISYVKEHWDTIGPAVKRMWDSVYPALQSIWEWLKRLGEAIWKTLVETWKDIQPTVVKVLKAIWSGLNELWDALVKVWDEIKGPLLSVFKQFWEVLKQLWGEIKAFWPILKILAQIVGGVLWVAFKLFIIALRVVGWIIANVVLRYIKIAMQVWGAFYAVVAWVVRAIVTVVTWLWGALKVIFEAMKPLFSAVGTAFKIVWDIIVAALKIAWQVIVAIWHAYITPLIAIAKIAWNAVAAIWGVAWNVISSVIQFVWNIIVTVFHAVFDPLIAIAKIIWDAVCIAWKVIWDVISSVLQFIWNILVMVWHAVIDPLIEVAKVVWDVLVAVWQAIWGAIKAVAEAVWNALVKVWHAVIDPLVSIIRTVWDFAAGVWSSVWGGIKGAAEAVWNALVTAWHTVMDPIINVVEHVWDGIQAVWDAVWGGITAGIKGAINVVIGIVRGLLTAWNAVPFHDDVALPDYMHLGGPVATTGTYYLEAGEYIIRKEAVSKLGGLLALSELNSIGVSASNPIPITPAMVIGATGGSTESTTEDNSQNLTIHNLNLYEVSHVQQMMDELNKIANRQSLRNITTKEKW